MKDTSNPVFLRQTLINAFTSVKVPAFQNV